ncbi:hypothetical protein D0Z07_8789 [Hyphodiscus hymeniophilus]|uniref:Mucin-7 protein n=1 Tax=Hyphodiscus hymeniophilus TaxID=353542 RepID=A0A9P6SKD7_9HELO|nr:hypothetical protein D0Z07_8789 [Hyphodiscus hymeniophilus]
MSSGVRNLRAMFENKDVSTSPPDRGRSPTGSIGPGSNGTSPRPLSKVRTSFVAVERSGQTGSQMGLKRENSGEPSMAKRRTSFSINEDEHPKMTAERKQSIASEYEARKNSTMVEETIPEVAVETPSIEVDKQLGEVIKATKNPKSPNAGLDLKKTAASNAHTNGSIKSATTEKTVDKAPSSRFTARPTPISTAKTSTAPKSSPKTVKHAVAPKTPKTPTTPRGRTKESVKEQEQKSEKKENKPHASSYPSKPISKPAASTTSASSKTRIPPSPPQTGFVKPKPRSPTRPVKLPASLTAHTASSGSKGGAAPAATSRQSLSRASGNSQATNPLQTQLTLSRSPSRVSVATAPKSLTRKPSTLSRAPSRPSLGPPPSQLKKQPSRQSLPPAPTDEGFLARMMRPTTSSASKTAEKTPPKRAQSVKRPVTRDGPSKTEVSKAAAPKMGTLVTKPASSSTPEKVKEGSKSGPVEVSKPEIPGVPTIPNAHAQGTGGADAEENISEEAEAPNTDAEKINIAEPESGVEAPFSAIPANVPEVESVSEKPAPMEDVLAAPQNPATKEEAPVVEEPVIQDEEEQVSQKTEDVEAVKEVLETSNPAPAPVPVKAVEVEIPEEVEAAEDPEDIKAREEIAKLNAEVLRASTEEEDVE